MARLLRCSLGIRSLSLWPHTRHYQCRIHDARLGRYPSVYVNHFTQFCLREHSVCWTRDKSLARGRSLDFGEPLPALVFLPSILLAEWSCSSDFISFQSLSNAVCTGPVGRLRAGACHARCNLYVHPRRRPNYSHAVHSGACPTCHGVFLFTLENDVRPVGDIAGGCSEKVPAPSTGSAEICRRRTMCRRRRGEAYIINICLSLTNPLSGCAQRTYSFDGRPI